jgi:hypothetical protein
MNPIFTLDPELNRVGPEPVSAPICGTRDMNNEVTSLIVGSVRAYRWCFKAPAGGS